MKKIWNSRTNKYEDMSGEIKDFLSELDALCKKHDLSISHEDKGGAFELQKYSSANMAWLKNTHKDF